MGFQRSVTVTPPNLKNIYIYKNDETGYVQKNPKKIIKNRLPTFTPSLTQIRLIFKKNSKTPSKQNFYKNRSSR
jgi:hypothetical protein